MRWCNRVLPLCQAAWLLSCASAVDSLEPAERADRVADYARASYGDAMIATLKDLVAFKTVHQDGLENSENPEFRAMTAYLRKKAEELGLDLEDHGAVVVVALGDGEKRFGVVTHGDVQPADPAAWANDPFLLDATSEPGRLVARGVVDDKGPIAAALYALKAIRDQGLPLGRRIELIVSYTEESDWEVFTRFLAAVPPPDLNVALDAEFPVVTGEKGWGIIKLTLPPMPEPATPEPRLVSFTGGAFVAQIPETARAVVASPTPELEALLSAAADRDPDVELTLTSRGRELTLEAHGVSAHSAKPWDGKNAITHLAKVLGAAPWPDSRAARMVRLVNDLVGTGDFAEKFGDLAYEHPFMGRLTLSLTVLEEVEGQLVAQINIRRPAGRSTDEVERLARRAVADWQARTGIGELEVEPSIFEPYLLEDAPHIPVLLDIFRRHTRRDAAGPVSQGGGTHARLMPAGLNFGPVMPGEPYTGHSEHEYMERDQLLLNLEMYTAMLVELAAESP